VAGVAAISVGALHLTERPPELPTPIRFQVLPPAEASLLSGTFNQALSPDGRHIAFNVQVAGGARQRLAIRAFGSEEARELPGTEGAAVTVLFWSPDNRFIGFFADGKLKKIDTSAAYPQILCDVPQGPPAGATWGIDGTILFGQNGGGLLCVSSGGGTPVPATMLRGDERIIARPAVVPARRPAFSAPCHRTARNRTSREFSLCRFARWRTARAGGAIRFKSRVCGRLLAVCSCRDAPGAAVRCGAHGDDGRSDGGDAECHEQQYYRRPLPSRPQRLACCRIGPFRLK